MLSKMTHDGHNYKYLFPQYDEVTVTVRCQKNLLQNSFNCHIYKTSESKFKTYDKYNNLFLKRNEIVLCYPSPCGVTANVADCHPAGPSSIPGIGNIVL